MDWVWPLAGPFIRPFLALVSDRREAVGRGATTIRRVNRLLKQKAPHRLSAKVDAGGFTLLEVMVALAIALPALLLLYRQGALALEITGSAMSTQNALSRAESHLAALTAGGITAGDREGDDGGGYRWHTRTRPLATAEPPRSVNARSRFAGGVTLYAASVTISWSGARGRQSVTLDSRLLGPAISQTP